MNKRIKTKIRKKNTVNTLIRSVSYCIDDFLILQSKVKMLENSNLELIQEIAMLKTYIEINVKTLGSYQKSKKMLMESGREF